MKMNQVLRQQLSFARNSNLEVDTDSLFSTVAMTADGEDLCFMQGEEADDFICDVEELYQEEEVTWEEAELIIGYPYLDLAH